MRIKTEELELKNNFKEYWNILRPYKKWVLILVLVLLVIQATNILDQYLLKILIDKGAEFSAETITKTDYLNIIYLVIGIYLTSSILKVGLRYARLHYLNQIELNGMRELKRKYFNHIIGLDYNFHTTHKTGSLISKITRGGNALERLTDTLAFNFIPAIFQTIISVGTLFALNTPSAITILLIVIIFIGYSYYIQRLQEPSSLQANKAEDHEKAQISDLITNVDSIKHFGKENTIKNRYAKIAEATKEKFRANWAYFQKLEVGQQIILAIGGFILLYFPVKQFINGQTTLGTVTFVATVYTSLIMTQLFNFVNGMRNFYRSMADLQPLFEYGKISNAIKDKKGAKKLEIKQGTISFDNITFSYHKRKIFENYTLNIKKNEKVALVGHSGSGKTTLIKLLYRLYDVQEGSINIDGKNIKELKQESLRGELSIVPQECILFDDTIFNNIKFSNPKATDEDVWNAIRFAQLDKIISELPYKEQTIVGERGVKLSGGEKQRVSIARALLANKKILVLDEATSALDSETEHEIQKDLQQLMKGRTTIIIAHRLSTIMTADRIIVMERGKIAQQGNHNELIKQQGPYKKLWNLQKGGYLK